MADIVDNSQEAKEHSRIREFVRLYDGSRGDGDFEFPMIEEWEFMKFWDSLIIARLTDGGDDFVHVYYGTRLVRVYGTDMTRRTLMSGKHTDAAEAFFGFFHESLTGRKPVYLSGSIDWKDRGHVKWCQVILPMKRGGEVKEVVSLLCFD